MLELGFSFPEVPAKGRYPFPVRDEEHLTVLLRHHRKTMEEFVKSPHASRFALRAQGNDTMLLAGMQEDDDESPRVLLDRVARTALDFSAFSAAQPGTSL